MTEKLLPIAAWGILLLLALYIGLRGVVICAVILLIISLFKAKEPQEPSEPHMPLQPSEPQQF
jgi:hypothetical protein